MNTAGKDFTELKWRPYLSEARFQKALKMKTEGQRQLYLGAEALLNRSLEIIQYSSPLPAEYERTSYGKPYLLPKGTLPYVNWSHSGTCAVCALADREVGIDLQYAEKKPGESLVRRVLEPEERCFYDQAAGEGRQRLFYEYWAVKESFLKALGTGFRTPLNTFYVQMEGEGPKIVRRDEGEPFTCRLLEFPEKDYTAAVCLEGFHPELEERIPITLIKD